MKTEDKVCTLEQAKELVKLGVILDTERHWVIYPNMETELKNMHVGFVFADTSRFPAPDVAELGILFGAYYNNLDLSLDDGVYGAYMMYMTKYVETFYLNSYKTEAEARCAALIWLIENKHLKAEDIKL